MSRHLSVIRFPRRLRRDDRGEAIVGFAFVLPVLVLLSLAIFEFGLVMFDFHRAGEATRRAVRLVAISNPVADVSGFSAGSTIQCTSSGGGVSCSGSATADAGVFDSMIADMQQILPAIAPQNVEIEYTDSGVGDPTTPGGIIPLVTVKLVNLTHAFYLVQLIPGMPEELTFPPFASNLLAAGLGPTAP